MDKQTDDSVLIETVKTYFQQEVPGDSPLFTKTREWRLLKNRRHKAKKGESWKEFKEYIRSLKSGYAMHEMSDLKASSGFFLQIFLHKGLHYENDDRSMCEKAGVLKYLNVFVSSIAQVYYYSLTLMHKNDSNNNDSYSFENHYPPFEETDADPGLIEAIDGFWQGKGYFMPEKEELQKLMPGYYYDQDLGEGQQLFQYLFEWSQGIS